MTILWAGVIPADAVDIVSERIDRLVRRANRQGFPVPAASFSSRSRAEYNGAMIDVVFCTISAEGELRLGDYTFVGTVSELEDGRPFVTYAPGAERVDISEDAVVNYCDHCQTFRQRNDTYLVTDRNDDLHQVGSTCIKDFTGHSPAAIVSWLNAITDLRITDDEIEGWQRSAIRFYSPQEIIAIASRIVSKDGYVSKAKAQDEDKTSTSEAVRNWLSNPRDRSMEQDYQDDPPAVALYLNTMQAIERLVDQPAPSDWVADIVRLASSTGVQWRHVGILGSAVILGLRAQEDHAERGDSHYFGAIGERMDFRAKVTGKFPFNGGYGPSFVIRMVTPEGNDAVTFTSQTSATVALMVGQEYNVAATVKNHERDSRTERETTVVTRAKWG